MIRWAGSKRKLLPVLLRHAPPHRRYVEPFAGSACLFFALCPRKALLGDKNSELMQAYRSVRDQPHEVASLLDKMPISEEYYYYLRDRAAVPATLVEGAARFLYLNRFCFNGVYRTNRAGRFNVPRGVRTGSLPGRAELLIWSERLKAASFLTGDFASCIAKVQKGDFVYLDPPYTKPGGRNRGEYGYSAFGALDIPRLTDALTAIDQAGAVFLLSYRCSSEMRETFRPWWQRTLTVRRHVAGFVAARANVRELLISNIPFREGVAG